MTIGVVIGVFVSLYLGWIYRIFKRTKSKSYFYDIDDNTVVETRHDNSDHHFVRLVIRNNELTDTIAFRFTDYFFKPNKVNIKLNSNNRFDFDYFEKNYEKNKDWIDHYQDGEIVEFMKNIFFVARNNEERPEEIILSTNLLNVKEILNIKITE
jgi:hypothetical protein